MQPDLDNMCPPGFDRLPGLYLGTVVKHLPHGKCKVFIHGVHDEAWKEYPDMLPSAVQMTPLFGGGYGGNGMFSLPCIGATVVCTFLNGDQNMPIIAGQLLGGENAFGQYELCHAKEISTAVSSDSEQSGGFFGTLKKLFSMSSEDQNLSSSAVQEYDKYDRHLITSGKSQYQMFENGKISAIVSDPIRTDADVEYKNSNVMDEQDDKVTSRPLCEKIANDEISNIYCKTVLDNNAGVNGSLSGITHFYNTYNINTLSVYDSPAEVSDITEVQSHILTSLIENNERYLNSGNVAITTTSSHNKTDLTSIVSASTEETMISAVNKTYDHDAGYKSDIGEKSKIYNKGKNGLTWSYTYYNNDNKHVIDKKYIERDEDESEMFTNKNCQGAVQANAAMSITSSFIDSWKPAETVIVKKDDSYAAGLNFTKKSFDANQYDQVRTVITTPTQYQVIDDDKITHGHGLVMQDGTSLAGEYKRKKTVTFSNGLTSKKDVRHKSYIEMPIEERDVQNNRIAKYYYKTVSESGAENIKDIEVTDSMNATDGTFILKIRNNKKKTESTIEMDADGVIYIRGDTSISMSAPRISIRGSTVEITGQAGDCKIKNVSLLNHVHKEMQSGDVVSAGSTSTKTATASN